MSMIDIFMYNFVYCLDIHINSQSFEFFYLTRYVGYNAQTKVEKKFLIVNTTTHANDMLLLASR